MKKLNQGILITLEGVDGSGKTTLAHAMADALLEEGYPVIVTREPGGTDLGRSIREVVQHAPSRPDPKAEFLLFAADRAHHINTLVRPALETGKIVISDRMADSSLAYQGYGRGVDIAMIEQVNCWAMGGVKPDFTVYIKVDLAVAWDRVAKRSVLSSFEQEKRDFFERVMRGFEVIFHGRSDVFSVDGSQSADTVAEQVLAQIMPLIARLEV